MKVPADTGFFDREFPAAAKILLFRIRFHAIMDVMGNRRAKAAYPPLSEGRPSRPKRKEGDAMITYQDLFLFCTFVVALINLIFQIFKGKK